MREGWEKKPLLDVAQVVMGQSPPGTSYNTTGDGLPFIQGSAEFGERHPAPAKWCTEPRKVADPGDLLLSVRAPVGDLNVANEQISVGRGLSIIRGHDGLASTPYLGHALAFGTHELAKRSSTGMFSSITGAQLKSLPVAIPPLHEQKRIVDLMDSVDAAISAAQAELDAAAAMEVCMNLEVFRPLLAGVIVEVSALTDMKLGRQKGGAAATDAPKYATVKSGSITSTHRVNPASFDEMPIPSSWISSHGLRPGDVVLAEGGTVGESAVWPEHLVGDYGYDKHVIRIRPVEGKSTTNFVAQWCRFMKASGTFDATATGKTISALGFGRAAKLPFPDMPPAQQEEAVSPLIAADSVVKKAQESLDRLRDLRSSLLSALLSSEHEIPETYDQFLDLPEVVQAG